MKINWKLRKSNKTVLFALLTCIVAFVYQVAGIIGWVPPVTQDMVTQLIAAALNVLVALGVLVDPTTGGLSDSQQALGYHEPKKQ